MKKIILYIACSFISIAAFAQDELGLNFMDRVMYHNYANPSYMNKSKVSVGLATNVGFNYLNSSWSPADLLADNANGDKVLSMSNLLDDLDDTDNSVTLSQTMNLFDLGLRFNKLQLTFGMSINTYAGMNYPKEFIGLLAQGNAAYIGETINIAPSFDIGAYASTSLGLSYQISDKLSIGARAKKLNGIMTISTDNANKIELTTDADAYQLTIETDYQFNKASEGFNVNVDGIDVNGEGGEEESFFESNEGYEFDLGSSFSKNSGMAFDVGLTYKVNDKITLAASAINLGGTINWDTGVQNLSSQKTINYDGENYTAFTGEDGADVGGSLDTLGSLLKFEETQENFTTSLPSSINLSGTYAVSESFNVGLLYNRTTIGDISRNNIMLSAQKHLGRWFSVGGTYAVKGDTYDNLGLNFTLNLGPLQFYGLTDNVITVLKPFDSRNASFRAGLLFVFGKKKYYKKKDDLSGL